jgi:hypothetical protein
MTLHRHHVASHAIASLAYDDETETGYVIFTDGSQYALEDFPQIEFERWLNASSLGKYWNYNLRGNY